MKYWPEIGKCGFLVWRYLLRRDDVEPAPWTSEGMERSKKLGLSVQVGTRTWTVVFILFLVFLLVPVNKFQRKKSVKLQIICKLKESCNGDKAKGTVNEACCPSSKLVCLYGLENQNLCPVL